MPQFTLQQLATITEGKLHGHKDHLVEKLETDSRTVNSSDNILFIAIKGPRHDGHQHLEELIRKGIRSFLIEHERPELTHAGANFIIVKNTVSALQKIAAHYRKELHMPLVAITGSNGKTVVKEWLAQCLSRRGSVSRSPKSYNSQIGVPLSIWLFQPEASWALVEAGISMPGEMTKLEKTISPDYGIITNIGPAHQKNFESLEQKVHEKISLFKNSKIVYYCRDHELIHATLEKEKGAYRTICWSKEDKDCFLYVSQLDKGDEITQLSIRFHEQTQRLSIPFTDDASLENCLHILTFLLHQKFEVQEIQDSLNALLPVAMRLEQISGRKNSTLINDSYNSDLHSLRIALDYLAMQKQHSKHTLILSDIKQSGLSAETLYREVFRMIKNYRIDQLIAVGKEIPKSKELPASAQRFRTTEELLANLSKINLSDRTILIKGAREYGFERIVNALSEKKHTTVLEINLDKLINNLNYFRSLLSPGTKIMVMVKALSYGSGSYEIANLLQHQKADYLGVAFTDEGVELRKAGINLPIMVMAPSAETYDEIIEHQLEPEIFSIAGLQSFARRVAIKQLNSYPVHIKLDTGMHRLGFMPGELELLIEELKRLKNLYVKTLFSHLAVSDNPNEDDFSLEQIRLFKEQSLSLSESLGYKPDLHILNSSGIERFPSAHFDMVRLGIGLHGISGVTDQLLPVSKLKTRICQIKKIPKTDTVGYNRHGVLDRDSSIAILPIGYADGLDRKLGNGNGQVIVNKQRVPFVGDICMDLCMIDITGIDVVVDDEVIIFGEENKIEQLALQVGTIPYEILTSVSSRVKRVYINE